MKWLQKKFSELYAIPSRNGLNRPSRVRGEGYKMVNMGELFANNWIGEVEMERVQMNEREVEQCSLAEGDLLFARQSLVLEGAGKCSLVTEVPEITTFESHLIRVRLDKTKASSAFYYYLFASPYSGIGAIVQQCAQAGIRGSQLAELPVVYPPPEIQHNIAEMLSAYDELIANNRRRMVLLEEAVRLLYEDWFVRLRFPGHEHSVVTNHLPQGWKRKSLADLCESIDYGYTASAEQEEVGPKFLRITDIVPDFIDWHAVPHCRIEDDRLEKFRLGDGDIVIARTGATVGYAKRLHKRHPEAVFASYLVRLRLKSEMDNLMAGVFVESPKYKSYVQSRVGGAAQPNANAKVLAGAEIVVPPPRIQRDFREVVEPLVDQRELLEIQNEKLRAARDLLLPRLMSGEILV
jgi:type I restriction enzyme, S subunit